MVFAAWWMLAPSPSSESRSFLSWSEATYEVALQGSLQDASSGISADYALDATIAIHPERRSSAETVVSLRVLQIERAFVNINGAEGLSAPGETTGTAMEELPFLVTFGPSGEVLRFSAPEAAQVSQARLVQLLLFELSFQVQQGRAWEVVEASQLGEALSSYRREGPDIVRNRAVYRTVRASSDARDVPSEGQTRITLDERGALETLVGEEHLRGAELNAQLRRRVTRVKRPVSRSPVAVAQRASQPLVAPITTGAKRASHAQLRARGLSYSALVEKLEKFGASGEVPDHARFIWEAVARLRVEPQRCESLLGFLRRPEFSKQGKALILDLLVGAGHHQAQAALREAMSMPRVRDHPSFSILFQRFALLKRPTPQTVAFLERARGEEKTAAAATISLGSAAGRLIRGQDPKEGHRIAAELSRSLDESEDPNAQRILLAALGNAGRAQDFERFERFARSESGTLRAATAAALRKLRTPRGRRLALKLATDPVDVVQIRALGTLQKQGLTEEVLEALLQDARAQKIQEVAVPTLLNAISGVAPDARRALLEALLQNPIADPSIGARVKAMLAALGP